jgi:hypothetical protein
MGDLVNAETVTGMIRQMQVMVGKRTIYRDFDNAETRAIATADPPPSIGKSPLAPGERCITKIRAIIEITQIPRFTIASTDTVRVGFVRLPVSSFNSYPLICHYVPLSRTASQLRPVYFPYNTLWVALLPDDMTLLLVNLSH